MKLITFIALGLAVFALQDAQSDLAAAVGVVLDETAKAVPNAKDLVAAETASLRTTAEALNQIADALPSNAELAGQVQQALPEWVKNLVQQYSSLVPKEVADVLQQSLSAVPTGADLLKFQASVLSNVASTLDALAQNLPSNEDVVNQVKQALQTAAEISGKLFAGFPNPLDIAQQLLKFVPPELLDQLKQLSSAVIPNGDVVGYVVKGLEQAADAVDNFANVIPTNQQLSEQYAALVPSTLADLAKQVPEGVVAGLQKLLGQVPTVQQVLAAYSAQLRAAAKSLEKIGAAFNQNPGFLQHN